MIEKIAAMSYPPNCDDLDYFEIADRTWSNLQTKAFNLIHENGGLAAIKPQKVVHLDFKTVYQKLKSSAPVNFVSCQ